MKKLTQFLFIVFVTLMSVSSASATEIVNWADWQSADGTGVSGEIINRNNRIDITFAGSYYFAQTNGGTNYWNPDAPYTTHDGTHPALAPPDSDIIALSTGGLKAVFFSEMVVNPLLAMTSWNAQSNVEFGTAIEIVNSGHGYWGSGSATLNANGTGFSTSGEFHGLIRVLGSMDAFSFIDDSENWHGFTVGLEPVPEPATILLLGAGLVGLLGSRIRKKK